MKNSKFKKGFTLIEMITTVAIMGILFVSVSTVTGQLNNASNKTSKTKIKDMELLQYSVITDIKSAKSVEVISPEKMILGNEDGSIIYEYKEQEIQRNGELLLSTPYCSFVCIDNKVSVEFRFGHLGEISIKGYL